MHMFNIPGTNIRYKTARRNNATAGRVNVPVSWVNKKVAVVLLEEITIEHYNIYVNLCRTCVHEFAECEGNPVFGTGNDNVYNCDKFELLEGEPKMKYNYGRCECCGREYPLGKLDDDGNCEHCIEYHNITDLDGESP